MNSEINEFYNGLNFFGKLFLENENLLLLLTFFLFVLIFLSFLPSIMMIHNSERKEEGSSIKELLPLFTRFFLAGIFTISICFFINQINTSIKETKSLIYELSEELLLKAVNDSNKNPVFTDFFISESFVNQQVYSFDITFDSKTYKNKNVLVLTNEHHKFNKTGLIKVDTSTLSSNELDFLNKEYNHFYNEKNRERIPFHEIDYIFINHP